MNLEGHFIKDIYKDKRNIAIITLILLILTLVFTLIQPLKYRASARLLVIQDYSALPDPYAASKSVEYLSGILVEVMHSGSFLNEVMHSGFNIDQSYFSLKPDKKQKQWIKTINAKAISDTGIISIDVYHPNKDQAEQIIQAICNVLEKKHTLYHGGGNKIFLKMIDQPFATNFPVKPNIILNLALAFIFGLSFGIGFVYLYPGYKIKLWSSKSSGNTKLEHSSTNGEMEEKVISNYYAAKPQGHFIKQNDVETLMALREREIYLRNYNKMNDEGKK